MCFFRKPSILAFSITSVLGTVLWGEDFEIGGKMWDFREIWHEMVKNPKFVSLPQCGHLPHEEQPERVNEELLRFLESWHKT